MFVRTHIRPTELERRYGRIMRAPDHDAGTVDLVNDITSGELDAVPVAPAGAQPVHQPQQPAQPAAADAQQPAQPAPPKSTRDLLSAAFQGAAQQPTDQAGAQSNDGRPRRADGTYMSAEEAAAQQQQAAQSGTEQQQQAAPVQLPPGLSPEEQQKFATLPAEMQQLVARTMGSLNEQASRYAEYGDLERLIGPRREPWALNGMSPTQAVQQLFALSDFATQRPVDFIQYFANQQGVDLNAIVQYASQQQQAVDPITARLQQQVQQLTGQLGQFTQSQQTAQHTAVLNEISTWAAEAGTDGKPLRPHFAALEAELVPHIQAVLKANPTWNRPQVLHEAYTRACWANPTIRTELVAADKARQLSDAAARGARAQSAASSVTGAPSGGTGVAAGAMNGSSVRDLLKQQFSASSGPV